MSGVRGDPLETCSRGTSRAPARRPCPACGREMVVERRRPGTVPRTADHGAARPRSAPRPPRLERRAASGCQPAAPSRLHRPRSRREHRHWPHGARQGDAGGGASRRLRARSAVSAFASFALAVVAPGKGAGGTARNSSARADRRARRHRPPPRSSRCSCWAAPAATTGSRRASRTPASSSRATSCRSPATPVGKVKDIELTADGQAELTLSIDDDYAPLRARHARHRPPGVAVRRRQPLHRPAARRAHPRRRSPTAA